MKKHYQNWQERSLTYGCLLKGLIINAAIFFIGAATIVWILNNQGTIQGPWAGIFTTVFVVLSVVLAFLQWYFPRSSDESRTTTSSSELSTPLPAISTFIHRVTTANCFGNYTDISHPLTNGNPKAFVLVTHNWNPPGKPSSIYNNHTIGVWYHEDVGKWAIFNQDKADMVVGMAFNVMVADSPNFLHGYM